MARRSQQSPKSSQGPKTFSIYFSAEDVEFLKSLPGDLGWSESVRRLVRDFEELFDLPAGMQEVLRRDMQSLGCATGRDYCFALLVARHAALMAQPVSPKDPSRRPTRPGR